MRFIRTEFKNVMSFGGDIVNTIDYSASSLSLVNGDNGVGKTNFTKLIEIGVYFEYPETVGDIKNWDSSEGYILHEISSNGAIWEIKSTFRKGLKSLTVHKNGELCDWGNPSSVQKKILEYIITVPFTVFKNILCSSMDNVSSVLKMNAKESRDITNQIFDLNDINLVGEFTSKLHYNKNKSLGEKKAEIDAQDITLKSQEDMLKEHKEQEDKDQKNKLEEFNNKLSALVKDIASIKSKLGKLEDDALLHEYFIDKGLLDNRMETLKELETKELETRGDIAKNNSVLKGMQKAEIEKIIEDNVKAVAPKREIVKEDKSILEALEASLQSLRNSKNDLRLKSIYLEHVDNAKEIARLEEEILERTNVRDETEKTLSEINDKVLHHDKFSMYFIGFSEVHTKLNDIISKHKPEIARLEALRDDLTKQSDQLNSIYTNLAEEKIDLDREIAFLKNPSCPLTGCDRVFSSPEYVTKLEEAEEALKILIGHISDNDAQRKVNDSNRAINDSKILEIKHVISADTAYIKSFVFNDDYPYEGSLKENFDIEAYKNKYSNPDIETLRQKITILTAEYEVVSSLITNLKNNKIALDSKNSMILHEIESNSITLEELAEKIIVFDSPNTEEEVSEKISEVSAEIKRINTDLSSLSAEIAVHDSRINDNERKLMDEFDGVVTVEDPRSMVEVKQGISDLTSSLEKITSDMAVANEDIRRRSLDIQSKYENLIGAIIPNKPYDEIKEEISVNSELLKTSEDSKKEIELKISHIENDDSDKKFKLFEESIKNQKAVIDKSTAEWHDLNKEFKSAEILKELYNGGWLKNELIGKVVGGINKIMLDITEKYDVAVRCEFDSSFNAKFYKDGIETKYGLCSLGQRKMMQLTAIIAIITYYKQIYRDINFIFLDEALSSLTEANANKMVSVVKEYLIQEMDMAVFISHHSYLKNTYFDKVYSLTSNKSYTSVEVKEQ